MFVQLLKMAMRRWRREERRKESELGSCTSTDGGVAGRVCDSTPLVMSTHSESSVSSGSIDNGLREQARLLHSNNTVLREDARCTSISIVGCYFIVKLFPQDMLDGNISTGVTASRGAIYL